MQSDPNVKKDADATDEHFRIDSDPPSGPPPQAWEGVMVDDDDGEFG